MNRKKIISNLYKLANKIRRVYWFVFRPERFGVKVLIQHDNKLLLVRHSYGSGWNLPGGGYNPKKETPEDAGRREVAEELGVQLTKVSQLGSYVSTLEYKRDNVYCLHAFSEGESLSPNEEIAEHKWFEREALPENPSTAVRKALEMLESKV